MNSETRMTIEEMAKTAGAIVSCPTCSVTMSVLPTMMQTAWLMPKRPTLGRVAITDFWGMSRKR